MVISATLLELASVDELDEGSEQFSPMQNVSDSPGVPMSVILRPVLVPLYQRIAG